MNWTGPEEISTTLRDILPREFDHDAVAILADRACFLLRTAGYPAQERPSPPSASLLSVFERIKSGKLIDRCYIPAMLASGTDDQEVNSLAGHILVASLSETRKGRRESASIGACREIRLLYVKKERRELRKLLGDFRTEDVAEVLHWLAKKRSQPEAVETATLGGQLARLHNLLDRYLKDTVVTRSGDARRHTSDVDPFVETDAPAMRFHRFFDRKDEASADSARVYADIDPVGSVAHRRSLALQDDHARTTAAQIVKSYMLSRCRWGGLSEQSVRTIVRELRAGVARKSRVDALLTASLLTGRPVLDLNNLRLTSAADIEGDPPGSSSRRRQPERFVHRSGRMALRTGLLLPPPPSHSDDDARDYTDYFEPAERTIYLPLPRELLPCLKGVKQPYVTEEAIAARVGELRKETGLTISRLAAAGQLWLYHNGVDRTLLARLFGTALAHAVPLYYENMEEERVLRAYDKWCAHVNVHLPTSPFTVERSRRTSRVGSRRTPKDQIVRNLFGKYRRWLDVRLRQSGRSALSVQEKHNHYALYTYLILSFATGLRPVRQPFETFRDFCEETATYFVRDKDSARQASPRFVPVPAFAVEQIRYYRQHLVWLRKRLGATGHQQQYVDAANASDVPYLFVFGDDAKQEPHPLTPLKLDGLLHSISPLPLIWPRHYLRTRLTDRGVHDEVIQAVMGHGEMGQEPLGRFSGLSMADLREVSTEVGRLAGKLDIRPLAYPGVPGEPVTPQRRSGAKLVLKERRKLLAKEKQATAYRDSVRGRQWAVATLREIERVVQENAVTLRQDGHQADLIPKNALATLDQELTERDAYLTARSHLAKGLDSINERLGLDIPIPPRPRQLPRDPPMRDEAMFRAQRSVQQAARAVWATIEQAATRLPLIDKHIVPLTLFSAACHGGLALPRALLALAQALVEGDLRLRCVPQPRPLCWVELRYLPKGSSTLLAHGESTAMRRWFPDGTTLALIVRYLRNGHARPRKPYDGEDQPYDGEDQPYDGEDQPYDGEDQPCDGEDQPYDGEDKLMAAIRRAVKELCGTNPLASMSLAQFARGALTVAEHQPGVRLPQFLVEYAHGLIESVSLPARYFDAYVGEPDSPGAKHAHDELVPPAALPTTAPRAGPPIDHNLKAIRQLFADLPRGRKDPARKELLRRMNHFLQGDRPEAVTVLVRWFRYLIVVGKVKPLTPQRYASWLAKGWLIQFEGVDITQLSAAEWSEALDELLGQEAVKASRDRNQVAARLAQFYRYLCEHQGYPRLPLNIRGGPMAPQFVRPAVIPDRHFAGFVKALSEAPIDAAEKPGIRWLFTLCYRLGTRIGETSRILLSDIEDCPNPVLKLRANAFGTIKNKRPHQLPLNPFLPEAERAGFHAWLTRRRRIARSPNELLFAPPRAPGLPWDTRHLGRLFSRLIHEATGRDYFPHACRHSAASRLFWIAEGEAPPDGSAYSPDEVRQLRDTVFTASPNCRDRPWHLSAVFNHAEPHMTLAKYVHVADLMLYTKISRSERRLAPKALGALLGFPAGRLARSDSCNQAGFLIEKVLPIVHTAWPEMFEIMDAVPASPEPDAGDPVSDSPDFDRFDLAQRILESLEDNDEVELVAIRYGVRERRVEALRDSTLALSTLRTKKGRFRLFSAERRSGNARPLAPTQAREPEDQQLIRTLLPALRDHYSGNEQVFRDSCIHWLNNTTTTGSGLRFSSPQDLASFLRLFGGDAAKVITARHRWGVRVSPVPGRDIEEIQRAWAVQSTGMRVQLKKRKTADGQTYPDGIARLHLERTQPQRENAKQDTSKAFRYVMHMLSILLLARDIFDAHGELPAARWRLG